METTVINNINFSIITEKSTEVIVNSSLYSLLEKYDENGYYNTHKTSYNIKEVINNIEEDGLEEYTGITEEDVALLHACKELLDNNKVDVIEFIEE